MVYPTMSFSPPRGSPEKQTSIDAEVPVFGGMGGGFPSLGFLAKPVQSPRQPLSPSRPAYRRPDVKRPRPETALRRADVRKLQARVLGEDRLALRSKQLTLYAAREDALCVAIHTQDMVMWGTAAGSVDCYLRGAATSRAFAHGSPVRAIALGLRAEVAIAAG